ncbi:MAG: multidrug efflux SMR transporter [Planctomycetia bacterium]|nr:multidrug efflux SMR transporter [Planctomycetia bacterium]
MSWIYLFVAAIAEVFFVLEMKLCEGFSRPGHSALTLVAMMLSVVFLSLAIRKLPASTAYAIWTGIGTVGAVVLDSCVFGLPFSFSRLACILLIILGVVGLKTITG